MPHFAYLKRCLMARRSDSNITAPRPPKQPPLLNSLGGLMRKTEHKSSEYTK